MLVKTKKKRKISIVNSVSRSKIGWDALLSWVLLVSVRDFNEGIIILPEEEGFLVFFHTVRKYKFPARIQFDVVVNSRNIV